MIPRPAFAALGGDVSSVQADQAHMNAQLRIQTGQAYTVHELHQTNGTVVKEFISPAGKVFAVSWSGAFMPDLRQLMGTYFGQFSQAVQTRRPASGTRAPQYSAKRFSRTKRRSYARFLWQSLLA